jgi:hypothetical protein
VEVGWHAVSGWGGEGGVLRARGTQPEWRWREQGARAGDAQKSAGVLQPVWRGEPEWVEGEERAGADALGLSAGERRGFSMGGGSREGGAGAGKARRSC